MHYVDAVATYIHIYKSIYNSAYNLTMKTNIARWF